jgi:hypothetical protein
LAGDVLDRKMPSRRQSFADFDTDPVGQVKIPTPDRGMDASGLVQETVAAFLEQGYDPHKNLNTG